jgi:hypothetical protein
MTNNSYLHNSNHANEYSKNDHGVEVTSHEGSLEASSRSVKNDTPGDQETSQLILHSGQGLDSGSSTKQKHRSHNDIGQERENEEGDVGRFSPTSTDNFAHSMSRGGDFLETDGKYTEEKNLDGGSTGVPKRPRHTVVPRNVGRLEEGGGPGPLRYDDGGGETGLDHATSGADD